MKNYANKCERATLTDLPTTERAVVPQEHAVTALAQRMGAGKEESLLGWTALPRRGTEGARGKGHGGCGRCAKLRFANQRWVLCLLLDFCYLRNDLHLQGSTDIIG